MGRALQWGEEVITLAALMACLVRSLWTPTSSTVALSAAAFAGYAYMQWLKAREQKARELETDKADAAQSEISKLKDRLGAIELQMSMRR